MAYNPNNPNGQATKAASAPVVLASDQGTLPVSLATAPTTPVTGTFWQVTQPVSLATNTPTLAAGANIVGKVGIDQTTNGTTNKVTIGTAATGGATSFTLISAASTNATNVKASAGTLYSINAYNNGAAAAYLKLYNLATAPTVGTSTAVMTILLPAGGGSNVVLPPMGIAFATGIAFAVTAVGTTADTTAVAANQCFVNGSYI